MQKPAERSERAERFNYRYPVRGRKQNSEKTMRTPLHWFNYRYPVRGRKLAAVVFILTNFFEFDLITVTP